MSSDIHLCNHTVRNLAVLHILHDAALEQFKAIVGDLGDIEEVGDGLGNAD